MLQNNAHFEVFLVLYSEHILLYNISMCILYLYALIKLHKQEHKADIVNSSLETFLLTAHSSLLMGH